MYHWQCSNKTVCDSSKRCLPAFCSHLGASSVGSLISIIENSKMVRQNLAHQRGLRGLRDTSRFRMFPMSRRATLFVYGGVIVVGTFLALLQAGQLSLFMLDEPVELLEELVKEPVAAKGVVNYMVSSSTSAQLMSQFQICGQCNGTTKSIGPVPVLICSQALRGARHILFYGANAWKVFGESLLEIWSGPATVHDCYTDLTDLLPQNMSFRKTCFYEQKTAPFPPDVGRLSEQVGDQRIVGIFNLKSVEWQLLHERGNWSAYEMLIVKFHWLENQSRHLLYLQVLQKLLKHF